MQNIGKKIMEARKRRSVSQRALAEKLSSNHTIIVSYEKGKHTPRLSTLQRIAEALECDLSELVSPEEMLLLKCSDESIEQAKKHTTIRAIDSYVHLLDDDPLISRSGEEGQLIYSSIFQNWLKIMLQKLFQMESAQRSYVFHNITRATDGVMSMSDDIFGSEGNIYEQFLQEISLDIEKIRKLPNKSDYLFLTRSIRKQAIKSFPHDSEEEKQEKARIVKELQNELSEFLYDCWDSDN